MKKQRLFEYQITEESFKELKKMLDNGWMIVNATPVLVGNVSLHTTTDHIVYVLEKDIEEDKKQPPKEVYPEYEVGEPVLYQNGDRFELGIVKSVCYDCKDEYFINYHTGDTGARTHARNLHKIANNYAFHIVRLDPDGNERG